MMRKRLTILVDGKNTLYRHNYTSNLISPEGQKVSGVHGMFREVANIIRIHRPDSIIICWDKGQSRERLKMYPEYKGNRDKSDLALQENLGFQILHAKMIFKGLPVKQISVEGVEADDVIGFLSKKMKGNKMVFSNDTDFLQLINEDTSLFFPTKKKLVTHKNVKEHLGFEPKMYVLWKSLVGDTSDNIKGIRGIGPVTATKVILGEKKVKINKELLDLNINLIRIGNVLNNEDKNNIVSQYKKESAKDVNPIIVRKVFRKLGFTNLLVNFNMSVGIFRQLQKTNQI
jgi:DNA polymerase-1